MSDTRNAHTLLPPPSYDELFGDAPVVQLPNPAQQLIPLAIDTTDLYTNQQIARSQQILNTIDSVLERNEDNAPNALNIIPAAAFVGVTTGTTFAGAMEAFGRRGELLSGLILLGMDIPFTYLLSAAVAADGDRDRFFSSLSYTAGFVGIFFSASALGLSMLFPSAPLWSIPTAELTAVIGARLAVEPRLHHLAARSINWIGNHLPTFFCNNSVPEQRITHERLSADCFLQAGPGLT